MKITHKILLLLVFMGQTMFGQFVHFHTHINNTDSKTRTKLIALIATLGLRNASLTASNGQLTTALASHQAQLQLQYTKNKYDRSSSFIASSIGSTVLGLGSSALARIPNLPYMTKDKQEYLDAVTMDKALLLALQSLSTTKIKSSKRQEVYRLRSKLLREFSKNDRDARQTLFMSAAGLVVLNYDEFIKLYNQLKLIEIIM